jgi:hypothetical protein
MNQHSTIENRPIHGLLKLFKSTKYSERISESHHYLHKINTSAHLLKFH